MGDKKKLPEIGSPFITSCLRSMKWHNTNVNGKAGKGAKEAIPLSTHKIYFGTGNPTEYLQDMFWCWQYYGVPKRCFGAGNTMEYQQNVLMLAIPLSTNKVCFDAGNPTEYPRYGLVLAIPQRTHKMF